jgi:hypothetical protein
VKIRLNVLKKKKRKKEEEKSSHLDRVKYQFSQKADLSRHLEEL